LKEYDIYVPLTYNDRTPIEPEKFRAIKERLLGEFSGLTYFPQRNEGYWQVGNVTFYDQIVIFRVLAEDVSRARTFLKALKEELKQNLRQEEVLIVERDVRIV
jgi:hypothetical protein